MDANIENKKIQLIQWISSLQDTAIIEEISQLREREKAGWWNKIAKEEKKSIQKGIEDANGGNLKPHSEARKVYGKWAIKYCGLSTTQFGKCMVCFHVIIE